MITLRLEHKPIRKVYAGYNHKIAEVFVDNDESQSDSELISRVCDIVRMNMPDEHIHVELTPKEKAIIAHLTDWDNPEVGFIWSDSKGNIFIRDQYVGKIVRGNETYLFIGGEKYLVK